MGNVNFSNFRTDRREFNDVNRVIDTSYNKARSQDETRNEAIEQIIAKFEPQLKKNRDNLEKQTKTEEAIKELQGVTNALSSSITSVNRVMAGSSTNMKASGVPNGVSITPSSTAKPGSYNIEIESIASKQRIVMQSQDNAGNPQPFPHGANDVTSIALLYGFIQGQSFDITSSSRHSNSIATVIIPNVPTSLQEIAGLINTQVSVAAAGGTPILIAYVVSDNIGDSLVLESTSPGIANNFYIAQMSPALAHSNLSVPSILQLENPETVTSIDIYNVLGDTFSNTDNLPGNGLKDGVWTVGPEGVDISFSADDMTDLYKIVNRINNNKQFTKGITAQVINLSADNYIIRVTGPLHCLCSSLNDIYTQTPDLNSSVIPTSCSDTIVKINGIPYNLKDATTIANPTPDIASITVSSNTPSTNFTIAQNNDTETMKTTITSMINSINATEQFIAQQKSQGTFSAISSVINDLRSMITDLSLPVGSVSFNTIGIEYYDFIPSHKEKAEGLQQARYLKIDSTKLDKALSTTMDDVKSLFIGKLTQTTAVAPISTILLSGINNTLPVSKFDLTVQMDNATNAVIARASIGGAAPIDFKYTPTTSSRGLISGTGIFSGLFMSYSRVDGSPIPAAPDTSSISITAGVSSILNRLPSYLQGLTSKFQAVDKNRHRYQKIQKEIEAKMQKRIQQIEAQSAALKRQKENMAFSSKMQYNMLFPNQSNS